MWKTSRVHYGGACGGSETTDWIALFLPIIKPGSSAILSPGRLVHPQVPSPLCCALLEGTKPAFGHLAANFGDVKSLFGRCRALIHNLPCKSRVLLHFPGTREIPVPTTAFGFSEPAGSSGLLKFRKEATWCWPYHFNSLTSLPPSLPLPGGWLWWCLCQKLSGTSYENLRGRSWPVLGWNRVFTDFVWLWPNAWQDCLKKRKGLCRSQLRRQGNRTAHIVAIWETEKGGC